MKQDKQSELKLLFTFIRPCIGLFLLTILFFMLNTLGNALIPQVVRFTVDGILKEDAAKIPAWILSVCPMAWLQEHFSLVLTAAAVSILVIALLNAAFSYAARTYSAIASETFVKGIRDALFSHIQRLPYCWHGSHQTGDILQRCTSDVDMVRNFVTNQLLEVIRTLFLLILYLTIMFLMNPKLAGIALAVIPFVILYSFYFSRKISSGFLACDEAESALSSVVQENLTGVRVVRAFGREKFERTRFSQRNEQLTSAWMHMGKFMGLYWSVGDFISSLQILIILTAGTYFTVKGEMSLGEFMAFISYNSSLAWPIRSLGRVISEMSKASVSVKRLAYILNEKEEEKQGSETPDMTQEIRFDHVNFSYDSNSPVLKDVTFTIPAGKVFGILGNTGSGKSTLVHLLNRLYELPADCGSIWIGNTNIRDIPLDYLRGNIGMVLQEPFLFSRTIKENIAITQDEIDMNQIQTAAAIACIHDSIEHFSEGYNTVVGERGVTLSGGQKQRVAIARMLMQKTPIIVFDDSLSAVDAETDEKIRTALKETMEQATILLISHRITTLMQAQCIMVLEDGKVTQLGTHEELLSQEGTYRNIYHIQSGSSVTN